MELFLTMLVMTLLMGIHSKSLSDRFSREFLDALKDVRGISIGDEQKTSLPYKRYYGYGKVDDDDDDVDDEEEEPLPTVPRPTGGSFRPRPTGGSFRPRPTRLPNMNKRQMYTDYPTTYTPLPPTSSPMMHFEELFYRGFAKLALHACPGGDEQCIRDIFMMFMNYYNECDAMHRESHICVIGMIVERRPDLANFLSVKNFWNLVSNFEHVKDMYMEPVFKFIMQSMSLTVSPCVMPTPSMPTTNIDDQINCVVNNLHQNRQRHGNMYDDFWNQFFTGSSQQVKKSYGGYGHMGNGYGYAGFGYYG